MEKTTTVTAQHKSQGARNFFFYFLTFALLYIVSISLGGVLFNIINKTFPIVGSYYNDSNGALRFNLSSLIIGTPIFLWLSMKIHRAEGTEPLMRQSGIRRWLTYITLIAAALIVIGDLIALVNYLLGGETTVRFILKALVVLAIAISIFYYYLTDAKDTRHMDTAKPSLLPKIYFQATAVVTLVVMVSGFFFIESPLVQRLRNQDNERINNLQEIQQTIINYASVHDSVLPKSLADVTLREGISADPVTKEPYQYEVTDSTKFRLCATFETSNKDKNSAGDYSGPYGPNWLHDKGPACFDMSFDQAVNGGPYPVKPVPVPVPAQ